MDKVAVVIVGSGVSGSVLAAKLSQAGKKVVVLEGGPDRRAADLYSSQIWARRVKWFGPPTETGGADAIAVNFGSGWGTGGAALHHYAVWLRRHADDFDMKVRFGKGLDWPISYRICSLTMTRFKRRSEFRGTRMLNRGGRRESRTRCRLSACSGKLR